jgi:hypothetical protein
VSGGAASLGGGAIVGGSCATGFSTGSSALGGCNCGTGGSSTGGACSDGLPDSGDCTKAYCAGECTRLPLNPPFSYLGIGRNWLFATPLAYIQRNASVVALGAVTVTDSDIMDLPAASFQLGIYSDRNNQPGDLLGSTDVIRAGPSSEGRLSQPVFIDDNSQYWIMMFNDDMNEVALEKEDTSTPEPTVLYTNGVNCLPSQTCPMPQLLDYNSNVYPPQPPFVPFLYAVFVPPS